LTALAQDPGSRRAIGVFDSGMGGLTVLAALRQALPQERFMYLGDTARLPYGTKSPATIVRYAVQAAELLVERGVGALVVACNTASSVALPALRERFDTLPVLGVIEPGAAAACAATRNRHVAVIGTEGTVRGGAYERAIRERLPDARVSSQACQLFVALAEEGWVEGEVVDAAVRRYLEFWLGRLQPAPDVLVLGCTHFPVLARAIEACAGPGVQLVDSAVTTAQAFRALWPPATAGAASSAQQGAVEFLATDGIERFARIGSRFLGAPIDAGEVELVEL
jgi:glutamate racemase